ncbi:MAG: hypothetical protein ABSD31_06660 [Candidatus Binataceae bacterium]|jgi:hypothetical protein
MLNSIQFAGLIVITLLLLLQLRFALRHERPVLLIITLVFFVYFVYSGGIRLQWYIREWSHNFDVSKHYITVATWLIVLVIISLRCGYSIPQSLKGATAGRAVTSYNQLLLLNLLGLGALALSFYLRGGIVSVWSRTVRDEPLLWYGLVTGLSELVLIYPLFTYYYIEESTTARLLISGAILVVYSVFGMVSGGTQDHVPRLGAFMLVWLARRKLTLRTALVVLVVGFGLVSVTRFSRQLGATMLLSGGGLSDAYAAYSDPDNCLNAANSFGEIIVFSKIIEVVDRRTDWQLGKSYLLMLESLVPSVLLPGKAEMLQDIDSQGFLPSYYGFQGDYWTSGFYGEAYVNFGLAGLVVVSWLVGMAIRRAELLLNSGGSVFWVPHWYVGCLLAGALLVGLRSDIGAALVEFVMRPMGLAIVFGELMSLWLPYGPVRMLEGAASRRLAVS